MKKEPTAGQDASPYKSVAEELTALRKTFRTTCRYYLERVESEIVRMHDRVVAAGAAVAENRRPPGAELPGAGAAKRGAIGGRSPAVDHRSEIADLRDMLTLLRNLEVKPEVGRRKDLKKIESVVNDLGSLTEHWG